MDDRHPIRLGESLCQQHIGFRRLGIRLQEVTTVEQHRVDFPGRDELQYLDLAAALLGQGGNIVVGDHHHLPVVGLVGPGDVAVLDHLAVRLTNALVADAPVVLGVHLMEFDVVVLGGAVHLNRDVHQPERNRTLPD